MGIRPSLTGQERQRRIDRQSPLLAHENKSRAARNDTLLSNAKLSSGHGLPPDQQSE
jgi:hypothetical protein